MKQGKTIHLLTSSKGVDIDLKEALKWYEVGASKHNSTDCIAAYSLIVLQEEDQKAFPKVGTFFKKCLKEPRNDYCAYAIGAYGLIYGEDFIKTHVRVRI